jgi:hypothetical protein
MISVSSRALSAPEIVNLSSEIGIMANWSAWDHRTPGQVRFDRKEENNMRVISLGSGVGTPLSILSAGQRSDQYRAQRNRIRRTAWRLASRKRRSQGKMAGHFGPRMRSRTHVD